MLNKFNDLYNKIMEASVYNDHHFWLFPDGTLENVTFGPKYSNREHSKFQLELDFLVMNILLLMVQLINLKL
jgi:hypothetical protein